MRARPQLRVHLVSPYQKKSLADTVLAIREEIRFGRHFEKRMGSRNWLFTLNNPEGDELDITEEWKAKIKHLVYQKEMGEEETPHFQGYLELHRPSRLAALKRFLPRAHWEQRKGTRLQAAEYCTKEETRVSQPMYIGGMPGWKDFLNSLKKAAPTSKSSELSEVLQQIQQALCEGSSTEDIADKHFEVWCRYYRAFEHYQLIKTPPRNHEVCVHVLQGPTGTGKSKWAMDNYPGAYWKQRSQWWCGYLGQDVVIIDEFYGWMPFDLLLRLCDRYPMSVETKGGNVQFVARTIVITTNQLPNSWYRNCYFPAFARRVNYWHVLPVWGDHEIYNDWATASSKMVENVVTP